MNRSIIIAIVAAAIAIPVGIYAASPLFTNTTIDEPAPVAAMGQSIEDEAMMEKNGAMVSDAMEGKNAAMADMSDEAMMEDKMTVRPLSGSFVGVGDGIHNAEGTARVIPLEDGSSVLRLEDFQSTNGPDLYVYLSVDKGASDFVDLGELKANIGNQNYEIPEGTNLSKYGTVLIWCKQFSVLFGSAELAA